MLGYNWKMRVAIILQNIAILGVFIAIGYYLDDRFQTSRHPYLIGAVIVSYFVNQTVSYFIIKKKTKNHPKKIDAFPQPEEKEGGIKTDLDLD